MIAGAALAGEPKRDRFGDPLPEGAVARLGTINVHLGAKAIAFSADGKSLWTIDDSSVRYWNAATGRLTRVISSFQASHTSSQSISADGLVCVTAARGVITASDLPSGKVRLRIPITAPNSCVVRCVSPGGLWAMIDFTSHPKTWLLNLSQASLRN